MSSPREPRLERHSGMPRPGERIAGRYNVLDIVGEGGFSVVYRARDEHAGGLVAIKVLSATRSADERFARRFESEVAMVRQLKHPNTIKVWDVGTTQTGCLFMVTEFIAGETLATLVTREAPLAMRRAVRIASRILRSLAEAHRAGIVHRDIKPDNVLVSSVSGDPDDVKVVDFGIAKADLFRREGWHTAPGSEVFTPQYSAPEVLRGEPAKPASDVYSVGLVLLEMLTGQRAVQGRTVWQTLAEQVSGERIAVPDMLSAHPVGDVLRQALAKDLPQRYSSADAMLRDLDSLPLGRDDLISGGGAAAPRPWRRWEIAGSLIAIGLLLFALARLIIWPTSPHPAGAANTAETAQADRDASLRRHCEDGDGEACHDLARSLVASASAPDAKVTSLHSQACLHRHAPSCVALSSSARQRGDASAALDHLESACRLDDGDACLSTGYAWLTGDGVAADPTRALPLLQRACQLDRVQACAGLGALYAEGLGVAPDPELAESFYRRACDAGDLPSCTRRAVLHVEGRVSPSDVDLARELLQRSCDGSDASGCAYLAGLYHRGRGVDDDGPRALTLYRQACSSGAMEGCVGAGLLLEGAEGVPADLDAATEYYVTACRGGAAVGCDRLLRRLQVRDAEPPSEAARLALEAACVAGHAGACELVDDSSTTAPD